MITIALAGKPNCGKSTFFRAATMAPAEIANYPFTTIDANFGVAYLRAVCPCRGLSLPCESCRDGVRFVPVNLVDVAGLVPDAHKAGVSGTSFLTTSGRPMPSSISWMPAGQPTARETR